MNNDIFLTEEGIEDIKRELAELKDVKRPELAARLKAAIEMGDLSENADYIKAKEDQGFLEGQIQELEETLKRVKVIDESSISNGKVTIGVNGNCQGRGLSGRDDPNCWIKRS